MPRRASLPFIVAMTRCRAWAALLGLCLLLSACAAPQLAREKKAMVSWEWPLSGGGGNIVYVKSISDFKGLPKVQGFWGKALDLLSGASDTEAAIMRPHGVLHDRSGRIYLADPGAGVVHCIDLLHGRYEAIGNSREAQLISPIGLAADDQGRIYITDSQLGMVYRYDPADRSLKPFLTINLGRPTGIAYNAVNHMLYVTDTQANAIIALGLEGMERYRLGVSGASAGLFNHPTDIAVDRTGLLLVNDSLNFRILVLTPEGELLRSIGTVGDAPGQFSRPKGVALDSAGHVYVCDSLRDAVQVFDRAGNSVLVFGRPGSEPGQFWMPSGIFIDGNDYIYVTDTYNRRIQVFRHVVGEDNAPVGLEPLPGPGSAPAPL
jgi:DNA-binding beta-propeller fold protein YncE